MLDPRSPFTGAQFPSGLDAFNSMEIDDNLFQVGPFVACLLQALTYPGFKVPKQECSLSATHEQEALPELS